jgi:hypothetical protein
LIRSPVNDVYANREQSWDTAAVEHFILERRLAPFYVGYADDNELPTYSDTATTAIAEAPTKKIATQLLSDATYTVDHQSSAAGNPSSSPLHRSSSFTSFPGDSRRSKRFSLVPAANSFLRQLSSTSRSALPSQHRHSIATSSSTVHRLASGVESVSATKNQPSLSQLAELYQDCIECPICFLVSFIRIFFILSFNV